MNDLLRKPINNDIHILVVDDEHFALNICIKHLKHFGYTDIDTASNGRVALEKMGSSDKPFDLIVLDINMPEIDGFEFMRHAQQILFNGSFILISGEDEKLLEVAYDFGETHGLRVLDAIPKPINADYFKTLLQRVESR